MQGPFLYIGAEDDADEIHRRLDHIRQGLGLPWGEFADFHFKALAGEDALLGTFDRAAQVMRATPLLGAWRIALRSGSYCLRVRHLGRRVRRRRNQSPASQAIRWAAAARLRQAQGHDCASVASIAFRHGKRKRHERIHRWNNSVRSRLYLTQDDANPDARTLKFMKSNYGPKGEPMKLIWRNGLFVPESVAEVVAKASNAETVFLQLLDAYNNEGRNVSASHSAITRLQRSPRTSAARVFASRLS